MREEELQEQLHRDQQIWIAARRDSAKAALDEIMNVLHKAGIFRRNTDFECSDPMDDRDAAFEILSQAQSKQCHTIAIGHDAHSWFHQLAGGNLSEHLLRVARGLTIWIVR